MKEENTIEIAWTSGETLFNGHIPQTIDQFVSNLQQAGIPLRWKK